MEYEQEITLPECLEPFRPGLHELDYRDYPSCIYFLLKRGRLQYIGQSVALYPRIYQHKRVRSFDRVLYIPTEDRRLNQMEYEFIRMLKPPLNRRAGPSHQPTMDELRARRLAWEKENHERHTPAKAAD